MSRRVYSLLCGLVFVWSTASAQAIDVAKEEQAPAVNLSVLVHELRQRNPEIQASLYRFQAATKRPSQLGTLPDPKLSITNFGVGHPFSGLNGSDFAYQAVGVTQELPFPGKLALASEQAKKEALTEREMYEATLELPFPGKLSEQAKKEALTEREMYEATLRDATSRLKVTYFEWASIAKQIEITKKNRDLLQRFEEIARRSRC